MPAMETKRDKYDTNPLDPDYGERADSEWGATRPIKGPTDEVKGATAQPRPTEDAPTRRMDAPFFSESYPSVFIPPKHEPPAAAAYRAPSAPAFNAPPTSRPV